ncbi:shikimate quinate 5-dehydrogenase [Seminavis robusta]|uniref:Shikimate quinate 5-dehydrogenase n=1 Tax=Seminavis robusta TaxID=568900 RepID=A0A9N8DRM8_9STRA|nr:shikimate quinate 5-dehydrogenase [Seminavis robusta]|eukprot:Sro205_g086130.1 shikimate quinate 5-dehydrogenase (303) ;mRNA; f:8795-9703
MKRAVSVSIGSSKRDKVVEVELLGEKIRIERIGTNGDMEAAALKFKELDGTVDALSVGGADLGTLVDGVFYPFHSVQPMIRYVKTTPVVDGCNLKNTLENRAPAFLEEKIGKYIQENGGKKVLVTMGGERWGLSSSFVEAGYEAVFGDLMFTMGIPVPIKSLNALKWTTKMIVPVATRFPLQWFYPTGEQQHVRTPKYTNYYDWATVITGDCMYIKQHMPDNMQGKVIVTNTTTPEDVALFKKLGVKYLVTTTPVLDGRSFGTNLIEATLVALAGKKRPLTLQELEEMIDKVGFGPQLQELN